MVVIMNNPPAFPALNEVGLEKAYGMTLRDYFAAKAMQGQINNPLPIGSDETHRLIAERSYRMADAMLKARES
jgi:hypothetical protein